MAKILTDAQNARLEKCRTGCPQYIRTPVLNTHHERCKACGCFIHLLVFRKASACEESRWT